MRLREISYGLKAAAEVAHAGEQLLGSLDRSRRGYGGPILLGIGLGVGLGALLFSESARQRVRTWLSSTPAHDETDGHLEHEHVEQPSVPH